MSAFRKRGTAPSDSITATNFFGSQVSLLHKKDPQTKELSVLQDEWVFK
jgi:hypothetical protein